METIRSIFAWIYTLLFKNVPFFIASCIGVLVLALVLLVYESCMKKDILATDMVMFPMDRPIPTLPMDLYITDEFSDNQIKILEKAAKDWETFSNGIVKINLVKGFDPPTFFSEDFYKEFSKHTIWMKTGNEEEVVKLFMKYSIVGDGFSVGNFIVVVNAFNKLDDNTLYTIFAHEISHQLGFEHIKNEYKALMNPGGNFGQFTNNDKIVFCFRYQCK